MRKLMRQLLIGACLLSSVGCAGGLGSGSRKGDQTAATESCTRPQIERGKPQPIIDGIGWIVGIPNKIILWNRRMENHDISPETELAMADYVNEQELGDTKVRLNQYDPIDEWRRLTANHRIGWGWRYTLGVWVWLDEAIFPGRIFGGDHYNAYTNTISIYSDSSVIAVKEGSRARDIKSRRYPGTYAAVNSLPLVSMWHETVATGYAFEYLHNDMPNTEQAGYQLLYPAYGAHLGSDLASFTPVPNLVGAALGAIPGHLYGWYETQNAPAQETARAQTDDSDE